MLQKQKILKMQKTILYLKPILKLLPHCARQLLTEASLETIFFFIYSFVWSWIKQLLDESALMQLNEIECI